MLLSRSKSEKQQRIVRFSDVDSIVIQTRGMHFELLPEGNVVKYRNVISPRKAGIRYPDGYLDEYKSLIPENTMSLISTTFERLVNNQTLEDNMDYLPPGATRDAYMRISSLGNIVYYTNTHAIKDGFQVKTGPVAEEFTLIVDLLEQFCSFPEYKYISIPFDSDGIENVIGVSEGHIQEECSKLLNLRQKGEPGLVAGLIWCQDKIVGVRHSEGAHAGVSFSAQLGSFPESTGACRKTHVR